jgi:small-conductance mechanosensitive channel
MGKTLALLGLEPGRTVLGNALGDWFYALALGLLTFAVLLFLRRHVSARARLFMGRELPPGLRLVLTLAARTHLVLLLALSLLAGSKYLDLGARPERLTTAVIVVLVTLQAGIWLSALARFYLEQQRGPAGDRNTKTMVTILQFVANLVIWSLVVLVALDNLGFQVKALLTGLGIGGIAVALAVQNVLGDLLASVSIALDKPFEIGDLLTLDAGYAGTVEAIGIKSTRLRSVTGEQIVMPNAELVKARIRNYGRLQERRSVFHFGVAQRTSRANLEAIPAIARAAVESCPGTRFERAHFQGFGAASLDFEVSYVVANPEYLRFMDTQQSVNLALCEQFERRGIRLATPVATLIVEQADGAAAVAVIPGRTA